MNQRISTFVAAGLVSFLLASPAVASTTPSADFKPGHSMGVGLAGLSYDYAFPAVSLGLSVASNNPTTLTGGRMLFGARGMGKFIQQGGLSAGVIAGVTFDPGVIGGRSYLIPDVGVGAAYRFTIANLPLSLRFNYTLTVDQGQNTPYYGPTPVPADPTYVAPRGNLWQRLSVGPNTMVSLAYHPSENLELTLGGGTLVGVRFTY